MSSQDPDQSTIFHRMTRSREVEELSLLRGASGFNSSFFILHSSCFSEKIVLVPSSTSGFMCWRPPGSKILNSAFFVSRRVFRRYIRKEKVQTHQNVKTGVQKMPIQWITSLGSVYFMFYYQSHLAAFSCIQPHLAAFIAAFEGVSQHVGLSIQ